MARFSLQSFKLIGLPRSTVIEMLLKESQQERLVAHFFYSHSQKLRLEAVDLFKSYIKQIIAHFDRTEESWSADLTSSLRRCFGRGASAPTFDEIANRLFVPLTRRVPNPIFVVDGLDECPSAEVQKVLKVFRTILSQRGMRVFISGRESLDIMQSIPGSLTIHISSDVVEVLEDIQQFVEWRVEEKTYERQLTENENLLQSLKTTLVDKADRM